MSKLLKLFLIDATAMAMPLIAWNQTMKMQIQPWFAYVSMEQMGLTVKSVWMIIGTFLGKELLQMLLMNANVSFYSYG